MNNLNKVENFIEETKGLVWGDIVNGITREDTETILSQVAENPSATKPDEDFFFTVPAGEESNEDNTTPYSLKELCEINTTLYSLKELCEILGIEVDG